MKPPVRITPLPLWNCSPVRAAVDSCLAQVKAHCDVGKTAIHAGITQELNRYMLSSHMVFTLKKEALHPPKWTSRKAATFSNLPPPGA